MRYSPLLLLSILLPPPAATAQTSPPVEVERGLVFGTGGGRELKLDLARPRDGEGPFPAVVCLHGGGWVGGDRGQLEQTIRVLAARGYVAVTPDYRVAPRDRFPAPVEDCKAAVRWLRANAARYKVNPLRVGVVGFAAGGHLACLVGLTGKEDGLEGVGGNADQPSGVQAVVSFFGPTDLTRSDWGKEARDNNLVPLLGGTLDDKPEQYRRASPLSYARKGAPPFLFIHGAEDRVVPVAHSRELAEKLRAAGGSARVLELEGEGHGLRGDKLFNSLVQMMAFLDENLKK
jgi:acetyl esterase/lipase